MTILEACVCVLRERGGHMTIREIHDAISLAQLYSFKAKDPASVVAAALRRHLRTGNSPSIVKVGAGVFRSA